MFLPKRHCIQTIINFHRHGYNNECRTHYYTIDFSLISSELSYASLIKELSRTGVYFKWQMLVTLLFVIPCHELYMRTVLQKELIKYNLPKWASILIVAICSSSLFIYLDNWWIVFFIL